MHRLQILPPDGFTFISCKFGHQVVPLALVANLAARWRHLHKLQIWPPDGATFIISWPVIVLLVSSARIESVSSSARVTSDKSQERCDTDEQTSGPIHILDPDKNMDTNIDDKYHTSGQSLVFAHF